MLSGTSGSIGNYKIQFTTKGINDTLQAGYILEIEQQKIDSVDYINTFLLSALDILSIESQYDLDYLQASFDNFNYLLYQYYTDLSQLLATETSNSVAQLNAIVTNFNTSTTGLLQNLTSYLTTTYNNQVLQLNTLSATLQTALQASYDGFVVQFGTNYDTKVSEFNALAATLTSYINASVALAQTAAETALTVLKDDLLAYLQAYYDAHSSDLTTSYNTFNTDLTTSYTTFDADLTAKYDYYILDALDVLTQVYQAAYFETMPIGTIISFSSLSVPSNYLVCDGSTFDYLVYVDLFALLGSNVLPDLRGVFVRGYDPTAVNDPDGATRALASFQTDANQSHSHTGTTDSGGGGNAPISATTAESTVPIYYSSTPGSATGNPRVYAGQATGLVTVSQTFTRHSHSINGTVNLPPHTHNFTTDLAGATESRPKNVALVYIIKAL